MRQFSTPSLETLRSLPVGVLQRALSASDVDHRQCIEKADLVAKVHSEFSSLPHAVRSEITALTTAPPSNIAHVDLHQALQARIARLHPDEQYSVRLFQVQPQRAYPKYRLCFAAFLSLRCTAAP